MRLDRVEARLVRNKAAHEDDKQKAAGRISQGIQFEQTKMRMQNSRIQNEFKEQVEYTSASRNDCRLFESELQLSKQDVAQRERKIGAHEMTIAEMQAKLKEMADLRQHLQEVEALLEQTTQDEKRTKAEAAQAQVALQEAHIRNKALEAQLHKVIEDQKAADKEWAAFDAAREAEQAKKPSKGKKERKSKKDKKNRMGASEADAGELRPD